jgi:hypothetical protein
MERKEGRQEGRREGRLVIPSVGADQCRRKVERENLHLAVFMVVAESGDAIMEV